jgi:hypothetical protein
MMHDSSMINFDMKKAMYDINTSKSRYVRLSFIEMAAVLDLIGLYGDINQEILDGNLESAGVTPAFRLATQ